MKSTETQVALILGFVLIVVVAVLSMAFLSRLQDKRRAEERKRSSAKIRYRGTVNPGIVVRKDYGVLGGFHAECEICGWKLKESLARTVLEFEEREIEAIMAHVCPSIEEMEAAKPKTWEKVE